MLVIKNNEDKDFIDEIIVLNILFLYPFTTEKIINEFYDIYLYKIKKDKEKIKRLIIFFELFLEKFITTKEDNLIIEKGLYKINPRYKYGFKNFLKINYNKKIIENINNIKYYVSSKFKDLDRINESMNINYNMNQYLNNIIILSNLVDDKPFVKKLKNIYQDLIKTKYKEKLLSQIKILKIEKDFDNFLKPLNKQKKISIYKLKFNKVKKENYNVLINLEIEKNIINLISRKESEIILNFDKSFFKVITVMIFHFEEFTPTKFIYDYFKYMNLDNVKLINEFRMYCIIRFIYDKEIFNEVMCNIEIMKKTFKEILILNFRKELLSHSEIYFDLIILYFSILINIDENFIKFFYYKIDLFNFILFSKKNIIYLDLIFNLKDFTLKIKLLKIFVEVKLISIFLENLIENNNDRIIWNKKPDIKKNSNDSPKINIFKGKDIDLIDNINSQGIKEKNIFLTEFVKYKLNEIKQSDFCMVSSMNSLNKIKKTNKNKRNVFKIKNNLLKTQYIPDTIKFESSLKKKAKIYKYFDMKYSLNKIYWKLKDNYQIELNFIINYLDVYLNIFNEFDIDKINENIEWYLGKDIIFLYKILIVIILKVDLYNINYYKNEFINLYAITTKIFKFLLKNNITKYKKSFKLNTIFKILIIELEIIYEKISKQPFEFITIIKGKKNYSRINNQIIIYLDLIYIIMEYDKDLYLEINDMFFYVLTIITIEKYFNEYWLFKYINFLKNISTLFEYNKLIKLFQKSNIFNIYNKSFNHFFPKGIIFNDYINTPQHFFFNTLFNCYLYIISKNLNFGIYLKNNNIFVEINKSINLT